MVRVDAEVDNFHSKSIFSIYSESLINLKLDFYDDHIIRLGRIVLRIESQIKLPLIVRPSPV